jgi:hypothetical protein
LATLDSLAVIITGINLVLASWLLLAILEPARRTRAILPLIIGVAGGFVLAIATAQMRVDSSSRLDSLERKASELETDIIDIRQNIDTIPQLVETAIKKSDNDLESKITVRMLEAIDQKVIGLRVGALEGKVSGIETEITNLRQKLETIPQIVETAIERVEINLESKITPKVLEAINQKIIAPRVGALEGKVSRMETDIINLRQKIETNPELVETAIDKFANDLEVNITAKVLERVDQKIDQKIDVKVSGMGTDIADLKQNFNDLPKNTRFVANLTDNPQFKERVVEITRVHDHLEVRIGSAQVKLNPRGKLAVYLTVRNDGQSSANISGDVSFCPAVDPVALESKDCKSAPPNINTCPQQTLLCSGYPIGAGEQTRQTPYATIPPEYISEGRGFRVLTKFCNTKECDIKVTTRIFEPRLEAKPTLLESSDFVPRPDYEPKT